MKAASSTVAVALLVLSNGCTGEVRPLPVGITPGTTGGAGGDNNVASGGTAGAGGASPSSPDAASPSGTPSGTGGAPPPPPDGGPGSGCLGGAVPADVAQTLKVRCLICHGNPPVSGVPGSLASYTDFSLPSKSDPARTMAQVVLARIAAPPPLQMPPAPASPLPPNEAQGLTAWIQAGMPLSGCPSPGSPSPDGGTPGAGAAPDPFAAVPTCTSGTMWTRGTSGSGLMQPGEACNACHSRGEGPRFAFGGTVYPRGPQPSQCNGGGPRGAQVLVADATRRSITPPVDGAGDFYPGARTLLP